MTFQWKTYLNPIVIESSSDDGQGQAQNIEPNDIIECIICMEKCTSNMPHKLSCLPCGHMLGYSCIKQWIERRKKDAQCPSCSKSVKIKDIVPLFMPTNINTNNNGISN
jgi:E3 ubiquitin-protein ligase RFWD3